MPIVDYKELSENATGESSEAIRTRVEKVRDLQLQRFGSDDRSGAVTAHSAMTPWLMKAHCQLDVESADLLVALTHADLSGHEAIQPDNLLEAIQYRSLDQTL